MKRGIVAFMAGLIIGATPIIHAIYIVGIVAAFEVGKHWPW
jgi:hypothetical protein